MRGFSLIELAVVLVIVGLLLGGGIAAFTATMEQTRRTDQDQQLKLVREALYGFAMRNRHLPCADIDHPPDGVENRRSDGNCMSGAKNGAIPWVTLGMARRDAWGYTLYYAVTTNPNPATTIEDYADRPASDESSFELDARANLRVEDGSGTAIAQEIPAVVVSFGAQGGQVWTDGGFHCPGDGSPAEGFSAAETENCDGDQTFVEAGYRGSDAEKGRFDDMVIWLPDTVLKARMVDAGRLP